MRARPRILLETVLECVSRIQTAEPTDLQFSICAFQGIISGASPIQYILSVVPLPRRIASRPVFSITETMELGGAVPSIKTSWSLRFASTFWMPRVYRGCEIMLPWNASGASTRGDRTIEFVQRSGDVLDAAFAGHWDREGRLLHRQAISISSILSIRANRPGKVQSWRGSRSDAGAMNNRLRARRGHSKGRMRTHWLVLLRAVRVFGIMIRWCVRALERMFGKRDRSRLARVWPEGLEDLEGLYILEADWAVCGIGDDLRGQ